MNHCCPIGGGGFIGVHVTVALLSQGRQVIALDTPLAPPHLSKAAKFVVGNYGHKETLRWALAGADTVLKLSYSNAPSTSVEDSVQDILGNVPAAAELFEIASNCTMQKIIVSSSGDTVYGLAQQELPLTEDHATNPISPSGVTKLAIEKYGHMCHRLKELPVVTIQPANALGEH